jgi:hypothetical protein
MSTAHLFYIPAVLFLGLMLGWKLGMKAVREEIARRKRRGEEI